MKSPQGTIEEAWKVSKAADLERLKALQMEEEANLQAFADHLAELILREGPKDSYVLTCRVGKDSPGSRLRWVANDSLLGWCSTNGYTIKTCKDEDDMQATLTHTVKLPSSLTSQRW